MFAIHQFSIVLVLIRVNGELVPIPAAFGQELICTPGLIVTQSQLAIVYPLIFPPKRDWPHFVISHPVLK